MSVPVANHLFLKLNNSGLNWTDIIDILLFNKYIYILKIQLSLSRKKLLSAAQILTKISVSFDVKLSGIVSS